MQPVIVVILTIVFPSMLLTIIAILSFREIRANERAKRKAAGEIPVIKTPAGWREMAEASGKAIMLPMDYSPGGTVAGTRELRRAICLHDGNPSHAHYCRKCGARISPRVTMYGGDEND